MQEHDFGKVADPESYVAVPAGVYRVRIAEVREGTTHDGSVRWALRLEVIEGEYAGRTAAWDGLVWNAKGLPRAKYVLARLGFDTAGRLAVDAEELVGRELVATLQEDLYEDRISGRRVMRLKVPYLGYAHASDGAGTPF